MNRYVRLYTKQFRKDVRKLQKSGRNLEKLERVIDILASGEALDKSHADHLLKGALRGSRECHIGPDWLLRYAKDNDNLILLLISTGDHRNVLGIE